MTKRRRDPQVIETAVAQRLSIFKSGLVLALERAIASRQWTQAEAARRLGLLSRASMISCRGDSRSSVSTR